MAGGHAHRRVLVAPSNTYTAAYAAANPAATSAQLGYLSTFEDALRTAGLIARPGQTLASKLILAFYPFLGGTSTAHQYNFFDPQAAADAYSLLFYGSPTHDANGIKFNGTSQYADTRLIPSAVLDNTTGLGLFAYVRENTSTGSIWDMGAGNQSGQALTLSARSSAFANNDCTLNAANLVGDSTVSDGFLATVRTLASAQLYRNGVLRRSTTTAAQFLPVSSVFLGATSGGSGTAAGGSATAAQYSPRRLACAGITRYLTSTQMTALRNATQTLMTSLGRQF